MLKGGEEGVEFDECGFVGGLSAVDCFSTVGEATLVGSRWDENLEALDLPKTQIGYRRGHLALSHLPDGTS